MFTPTMWANPNNLELIKEKKETEQLDSNIINNIENKKIDSEGKFSETIYKFLISVRLFKTSQST